MKSMLSLFKNTQKKNTSGTKKKNVLVIHYQDQLIIKKRGKNPIEEKNIVSELIIPSWNSLD